MGKDKQKASLFESFEDKRMTIAVGLICWIYFLTCYLFETPWIAKVLPLWPLHVFAWIGTVTAAVQITVWRKFRHFHKGWIFPPSLVLFICEYGLLLFTVLFLSWPIFWFLEVALSKR